MTTDATTGFFISTTLTEAWRLFKVKWLQYYGIILLPMVVAFVYALLSGSVSGFLAIILWILYIVIQIILSMGVIALSLNLIRNKEVSAQVVMDTAPRAVDYILGMLAYAGIVIGGLILLVVPGVIWGIKYMFAPYLIIDKGLKPMEALKQSAQMTKNIRLDLVGFFTASAVVLYAGALALVVGLLVSIPVVSLAYFLLYERLLERV